VGGDCARILEEMRVELRLVWGDSLGAKSFSFRVGPVLVDPGAAAMHPSYPLPSEAKSSLKAEALRRVVEASKGAELVVITHYHYDHYVRPWEEGWSWLWPVYDGKVVVAKDPNVLINESQWSRARRLVESLAARAGLEVSDVYCEAGDIGDLVERLGDPEEEAARRWLGKLAGLWRRGPWVCRRLELDWEEFRVRLTFADEGVFEAGGVTVRLLGSFFHGRPWERTGWVVPLLLEARGERILYTSDLMGPMHGGYVDPLAALKPDIVIADGPPSYMSPYRFPRRVIEAAVENAARLVLEAKPKLIVYDHHLLRERRWRGWLRPLLGAAEEAGTVVSTVAECLGRSPILDEQEQSEQSG
jgi:predicted metallo-beta-lactamase superfamily hydrolase